MKKRSAYLLPVVLALLAAGTPLCAQELIIHMPRGGNYMHYIVQNGDTVYVETLRPSYSFARSRKRSRNWRDEYRLLHNFGKVYPYALEAGRLIVEVDSTIAGDELRRGKKEKYIASIQDQLLDAYEPVLREMTVSQGKLLIRLIDRETGITPYDLIKNYKSGAAAAFWQGIAKMFDGDLKRGYDPEGIDRPTEELVEKWNSGEYDALYWSVFGKMPEKVIAKRVETHSPKAAAREKKSIFRKKNKA